MNGKIREQDLDETLLLISSSEVLWQLNRDEYSNMRMMNRVHEWRNIEKFLWEFHSVDLPTGIQSSHSFLLWQEWLLSLSIHWQLTKMHFIVFLYCTLLPIEWKFRRTLSMHQRCPWRRCRCRAAPAVAIAAVYFSLPSRRGTGTCSAAMDISAMHEWRKECFCVLKKWGHYRIGQCVRPVARPFTR